MIKYNRRKILDENVFFYMKFGEIGSTYQCNHREDVQISENKT